MSGGAANRTVTDAAVVGAGDPAVAAVEVSLAAIHPLIHELELKVAELGIPVAPLYLASARGSLRHVSACIDHHERRMFASADVTEVVQGSGVTLLPKDDLQGVATRGRRTSRGLEQDALAEVPAWAATPDLGVDLLGSPATASLCSGPVGSTLMFCALANHRWMHRATGSKWSTDASGAYRLIAALNDGAGCAMPVSGPAARLVDGEVLKHFAVLGWVRIHSLPMPGAPKR